MDTQTIQTYNNMAAEYDAETTDFWNRFPRTFIDKFAQLSAGKILDAGCGPGRDALLLKNKGLSVVCLDASQTMVSLCKEKGLEAVVGDLAQLPFADNSFDGVWSYTALLHVPKSEIEKCIKEIFRVLKPQGVFGLGLIEGETEGYRESSGVNRARWFSYYTKKEIEKLATENQFTEVYFEEFTPSSKKYLNYIFRKNT